MTRPNTIAALMLLAATALCDDGTGAVPPEKPGRDRNSPGLPAPVFAVSFDAGDAAADVALADPKPDLETHGKAEKTLRFAPGLRGEGLLIGKDCPRVRYAPGNLPLVAGTWMAWFKPQNWALGKERRNLLFLVEPAADRGYFGVQKDFEITPEGVATFGVWLSRFPDQRGSRVRCQAPGFEKDRWHLAVLRWNGRRFWASIDDAPPGELRLRRPLRPGDTSGIIAFGSPFSAETTVIDDIRIYDRCLSHHQIEAIWRATHGPTQH